MLQTFAKKSLWAKVDKQQIKIIQKIAPGPS